MSEGMSVKLKEREEERREWSSVLPWFEGVGWLQKVGVVDGVRKREG
jgi:hypothetical protein